MGVIGDAREHTRDVRLAFDSLAHNHQSFIQQLGEDLYTRRLWDLLLPYLEKYAGQEPLLDVGSGPGYWTGWMARRGFEVHSFDLSSNMVSLAKQNLSHPRLVQMDVEKMGFADSQYSLLFAIGDVLSYVCDFRSALQELRRVAKPNGVLVGTVISTGGVLTKELKQSNNAAVRRLVENGWWEERTVEELQFAREMCSNTDEIPGSLYATTYTSERLRRALRPVPAKVLTIQGLGVLRRLGVEEPDLVTQESVELDGLLGQTHPWMDISTNLFFAVRFAK